MVDVQLTPECQRFVESEVNRGRYASPSELVAVALRLFEERERLLHEHSASIREEIAEGAEAQARGEMVDGETAFDRLERKIDQLDEAAQAG